MNPGQRLLLSLYWRGSGSYRWWRQRRMTAAGLAPISVLVFHRIADDRANDWTTPTDTFVRAIHWLKSRFDLISLEEAQCRIRSGSNPRAAVAITFDDGYAANCRVALPLLIEERIPCTYFVCTQPALEGTPFAHDQAQGNLFQPNGVQELRALAAAGIEIGAHSRTHPDFGRITDPATLHDELVTARDDLAEAVGQPIRYFAFPFGCPKNLTVEAFQLARAAGYEGVVSAYGGYNFPGGDAFHLQRRGAERSLLRLKNWATFDPWHDRKIRHRLAGTEWGQGHSRASG